MKLLCISASNIVQKESGTSYKICQLVIDKMSNKIKNIKQNVIELKKHILEPCIGCGKCFYTNRCIIKDDFNIIYEKIIDNDIVVFVSPHYAPIPAKLAILLEKMEQITFLKWVKDNSYFCARKNASHFSLSGARKRHIQPERYVSFGDNKRIKNHTQLKSIFSYCINTRNKVY